MAAAGEAPVPDAAPPPPARFPDNAWVALDLRTEYLAGARGRYKFINWYGGMTCRTRTGEAVALDGFVGEHSEAGELGGEPVGATVIYANSLYGVDAARGLMKQYDVCRWLRQRGAERTLPDGTTVRDQWRELASNRAAPTPMPRHVYGCLVYAETTDSAYLYRGAAGGSPPEMDMLWAFDFGRGRWRLVEKDRARLPPHVPGSSYENKMGFLPGPDGHPGHLYFFYASRKGPAWMFDLKTESWSAAGDETVPVNLWSASMATDTRRRRFLFVGGKMAEGPDLWTFEADTRRWQKLDLAPGSPAPPPRDNPGWVYLPRADRFFLYGGRGCYDHWLFDPEAARWTPLADIEPPAHGEPRPNSTAPAQQWCYLVYDPVHDLVVLARHVNQAPTWLAMRFRAP